MPSEFLETLGLVPLADGQQWAVACFRRIGYDEYDIVPFRYRSTLLLSGREDNVISVPVGFITDLASMPNIVQGILPPWNRYGPAAVIHDWLYWSQEHPREIADGILREAMCLLGVDGGTIELIHNAVRVFGAQAWDEDARLKKSGYSRMAPLDTSLAPYASPV